MPEQPSTRLPLYAQVEDVLVARISSGALPVGTQLPSEEELIREYRRQQDYDPRDDPEPCAQGAGGD
jgi:hypothetical protein